MGIQGKKEGEEEEETVMKSDVEQPSKRGHKSNEESGGLGLGGARSAVR